MGTLVVRRTECNVLVTRDGDVVYPLTPCCRRPAWVAADGYTACGECFRHIGEAFGLAALVTDRFFRRDLRAMLEAFGCDSPGDCADILVEHYEAGNH